MREATIPVAADTGPSWSITRSDVASDPMATTRTSSPVTPVLSARPGDPVGARSTHGRTTVATPTVMHQMKR